ncbi:MAG TPA: secretin N-terminal domain-containing protein [Methylotenera sp.]|nr:secretin N-terminal domain-containing protein [Methylotenera sp.]
MRGLLILKLWAALCCMLFVTQVFAASEFKIITLQHRFAEDLLPTIQPLVGADGSVSGIQNQLIIRATPEKMAEIEQVIATLDVARQNLKIIVSRQNDVQTERDGVNVSGRKRIGNVEIGTRRFPKSAADGIQVDIDNNQSNTLSNSQQYINVVDGERAFIHVGESVSFTREWVTLTRRYSSVQRTTEFVDVTTGFAVRPRSIGNQIELEITPRIAKLNQSGFIDFEELTTVVRVNKGEWLDLGGIMQQKDDVSRTILSKQTSSQTQNNQLLIQVQ